MNVYVYVKSVAHISREGRHHRVHPAPPPVEALTRSHLTEQNFKCPLFG